MTVLAAEPTIFEQYALELVNRARRFPLGEVTQANAWVDRKEAEFGTRVPFDWEGTPGLNEGLSTTPPTIDDVQWNDFPGGRTVDFGGYTWRVKGPGYYGPGGNLFCHTEDCVWVDSSDQLHLTLSNRSGSWYSTEVVTEEALGYGDYILTTVGRLDLLDPQAVLGIFLWEYGPCWDYAYTYWNAFNASSRWLQNRTRQGSDAANVNKVMGVAADNTSKAFKMALAAAGT